jgi:aminoglycoside phosphotransferase (APT) family kinase protein
VQEWAPEVRVDEALARRLIADQFPEVEQRSFRLLGEGWDNTVWLVDEEWVFRFPRREMVIPGLLNEIAFLPQLAPRLPLPIPVPTLVGEPTGDFRWPFHGAPFLPGKELADSPLEDEARSRIGRPLGEFLRALHSLDVDGDLPVDPVRRADMTFRVPKTRERFRQLEELGIWAAPTTAHEIVERAATLEPPEATAVVHGDLHLRHLLVHGNGAPAAVIDWIDLSRNEPGVDLGLYWATLPAEGRADFADAYGPVEEADLARGRILALFICGTLAVWGPHRRHPCDGARSA